MNSSNNELSIDGNWINLNDGDKQIDVYISNFFWRQAVFVDEKKVSQKSAFTEHEFECDAKRYELKIKYRNFRDGECKLYRGGDLLDSANFSLFNKDSSNDFINIFWLHMLFAVGVGVVVAAPLIAFLKMLIA